MSGTAIIYYVVGYSEMREKIQNFRLDRIYRTPELLAEEPQIPAPNDFHLAEYSREVFRMFGTDEAVEVELLCKNYIMNAVIDHFGSGIPVQKVDQEHFKIRPVVCPSPTFCR